MQLTASGEYAIRAMVHLAGHPAGTVLPIGEIARAWEIPEDFLRKIIAALRHSGLVRSKRGIAGGVMLAKPSGSISALEIFEAVQGTVEVNKCVNDPGECTRAPSCSLRWLWTEAQQRFRQTLGHHSIAELADRERVGIAVKSTAALGDERND